MADVAKGFAPTLSDETARDTINARRAGKPRKLLAGDLGKIEVGNEWDVSFVDNACNGLRDLIETLAADGAKVDNFNFDRVACSLLHRELRLPPKLAASDGFWRWMAVEKAGDVIEKRMRNPAKGLHAARANYGIGSRDISQNRLAILWLRADMLYEEVSADNPYHLAERFLHTDFFESGILRTRYGWCRNLARTLVRFQYPDRNNGKPRLRGGTNPHGIRALFKRLRHLHSVYAFEFMTGTELWDVLEKNSRDLLRAKS